MTRLKGKIKSIPVISVTEGMQVLLNNNVIAIVKKIKDNGFIIIHNPNYDDGDTTPDALKTLVVEYEQFEKGNFKEFPHLKQLPLKYSQWQTAIDNGEVDSDKEVEFEVVTRAIPCPDNIEGCELLHVRTYVKIIPQRLSEFRDKYADMYVGANRKKIALDLNEHAIPIIPLGLIFNIGGVDYFGATDNKGRNLAVVPATSQLLPSKDPNQKWKFVEADKKGYTLEEVRMIAYDCYKIGIQQGQDPGTTPFEETFKLVLVRY